MKFGIATFVDDDSIDPVSLAQAIEERGGGDLPAWYYKTLDPFVTLAAAAAVTSTIQLVTGVALLIQRDPIHTAKESASIDLISDGRFVFGVGAGWNLEEMRDHGTDPKTRGARLDESIEAVKALWTDEPAEYHGKYVNFESSYCRPKPVQKPHPPIYVGGNSDAMVKRIIRHGAGWISNPLPRDVLTKRIGQLRAGAGHDVPLMMFGAPVKTDYWRTAEDLGFGAVGRQGRVAAPARRVRRGSEEISVEPLSVGGWLAARRFFVETGELPQSTHS